MPANKCVVAINKALKNAGHEIALIRGSGYYYLIDTGEGTTAAAMPTTSIPVFRLDPEDYELARSWVNDFLRDAGLNTI